MAEDPHRDAQGRWLKENPPPTAFKKGQAPGPGRKSLRKLIEQHVTDEEWLRAIARFAKEAQNGRLSRDRREAFRLLAERRDGMPTQYQAMDEEQFLDRVRQIAQKLGVDPEEAVAEAKRVREEQG